MKQIPLLLAVRALSAEFARRIYVPILLSLSGSVALILITLIWAVTVSAWWWVLLAPFILFSVIFTLVAIAIWLIIRLVRPSQTANQKLAVRSLVDSVQNSAEAIQTPNFIILFRLVKDVVKPGEKSYIGELTTSAGSLRSGFQDVIRSFQQ